jgi:hypothetical protein
MLAYKIQTPGNYPEENIKHKTDSELFKFCSVPFGPMKHEYGATKKITNKMYYID